MINPSEKAARPKQELTEVECLLLHDFLAFSSNPRGSAELTELHLMTSIAIAQHGATKPS